MATADLPRSKKRAAKQAPEAEPAEPRTRRSRAFRYGCYATLVLLVVGIALAPTIASYTPLGTWALQTALPVDGTVSLGSLSLGWLTPVDVEELEIRDASGDAFVVVPAVRSEKSLIGLLLDFTDMGVVTVDQPRLHVVFHERDSNLEQAFATLLSQSTSTPFRVELKVTGAEVVVDDTFAKRQFRLENVSVDGIVSSGNQPITLVASGQLADQRQPGDFKIELRTQGSTQNSAPFASGKIDAQANALPLEMAEPLARRRLDKAELSGRLSTRLAGAWGELAADGQANVQGESLITNLAVAATALGNDRLELPRVEMPCRIAQKGDLIDIQQLAVNCELGKVELAGSFKQEDLSASQVLQALARENYELKGHVDLAQLARMLPDTLAIREGTEVTAGRVDLVLASRQQPEGMTWNGTIDIGQLGARADGRAFTWDNPLAIEFATHEAKSGIVIDRARCTSSFLQVDAAGTLDDAKATAKFDLSRLMAELQQFSDLKGLKLAGQGTAQLNCQRTAENQFNAQGQAQAQGFQLTGPAGRTWREDNVVAKLNVDGAIKDGALTRVEHAELTVEAGNDRLQARLEQPVDNPRSATWPLQCSWRGALASWPGRLDSCLGITGWDLAGTGSLQATLRCSAETVEVTQCKGDVAQLRAWGHGCFINEPTVSIATDARCDLAKLRVEIAQLTAKAGATTVVASQAVLASQPTGWALLGGTTQLYGDLAQWQRWHQDPRATPQWHVSGQLRAEGEVKHEAGTTSATLNGVIEQLRLAEVARPAQGGPQPAAWTEPKVTLSAQGVYRTDNQQVQVQRLQLASAALACDLAGAVALADAGGDVDLKGTIEYDWQELAPAWRQVLGNSVQIAGRQARAVALHGHLNGPPTAADSWRQVTGEVSVGWTSMNVYGLQVGQADVSATLADGQLRIQPMDVPISQGRFTFAPVARLTPGPAELYLSTGPLMTNVHLSPEICARGLKFIAPILAETTVAEGTFSMTLDGGHLPLLDPTAGDVSGRMAIRGQATSGPVAREFLLLINELTSLFRQGSLLPVGDQSKALMSVDSSQIEFRMVNRRIYHRGLKFTAGSVPIVTHGSVGFDETLAMVAEVPIQATFLGRDLSLGALEGRTIQIPIGGTLSRPQLDRGTMRQLVGQMLENTARGALLDQVNKQFERLVPTQTPTR